jgi:hypothetical protein
MEQKERPIMRRILGLLVLLLIALPLLATASFAVQAQSGNLWTAFYYNNPDWAGNPVYIESTSVIAYNWGNGSPGHGVPVDNFTASYTTSAFFYAGTYQFTTTADDEIALIIDGVTYIDTRGQGQSGKSQVINVSMWQGYHNIEVFYREFTQTAYVYVTWAYLKPDTPPPPVLPPPAPTPAACTPQSAPSVQTQFGDYTPCIQQGLHQSACFQSSGAWDSPNLGSIQTEPQIQIWMACTPDSVTSFPVSCDPNVPPKSYKCSKTGAGYFPN